MHSTIIVVNHSAYWPFVRTAVLLALCQKQSTVQYIPRNMHTVFALLCFVVVIHWLIFPYPSGLLHWHCGNLTIAPVPAKQPWWMWINTSCEFIMNDCITTTKQSTTKPRANFLGYTVGTPSIPFAWGGYGMGTLSTFLTLCRENSVVIGGFPQKELVMGKFDVYSAASSNNADTNALGANMGPFWGRQDPGGPHVGLMNFAIWEAIRNIRDIRHRDVPVMSLMSVDVL